MKISLGNDTPIEVGSLGIPLGLLRDGIPYRVVMIQDSINFEEIIEEDKDPVILDIDRFYELCELAINELREGAFEIGLWRPHNVESLRAIIDEAITIHGAMNIIRTLIDPREEEGDPQDV